MASEQEIAERKANSEEKYRQRKKEAEKQIERRKNGIKFFHEERLPLYVTTLNCNTPVSFTWKKQDLFLEFAFTVLSEKDMYSAKIAKGILGNRMMEKDKYHIKMVLPVDIKKEEAIASFITSNIMTNAILPGFVPDCLHRAVICGIKNGARCFPPSKE